MKLRVLVGCEFSGTVRRAFAAKGHDAWSCDLLPASDGDPKHYQCDVRELIQPGRWDLGIFHPPCTYLTSAGLHWNKRNPERALLTEEALEFARVLLSAPIPQIALENPVGCISSAIRRPDQIIQPYEFGADASKKTCLWLVGLEPLRVNPELRVPGRLVEWPRGSGKLVERWANQTDSGQNNLPPSDDRWAIRSLTYPGIASAMADAWG